jgi:hypothetical protein
MADCVKCDVSAGSAAEFAPAATAAEFTVDMSEHDDRLALYVANGNTDTEVRVKLKAGDGVRAILGDQDVDIAASKNYIIPLADSERFKTYTSSDMTVQLVTTADEALSTAQLGNVTVASIQG